MFSLAVDTSSPSGSLAILENGTLRAVLMTGGQETYSSRMFRHLDFLLGESRVKMSDFDFFSVASGPGSFTGLRVGLAAVKGWAEVYGKLVAPVSVLDAVAVGARCANGVLASVLDARRGEVYGSLYRGNANGIGEKMGEEVVMSPMDFVAHVAASAAGQSVTFATPSPQIVSKGVAGSPLADARVVAVSGAIATFVGELGYFRAQRGELVDALHVDANYVRRSDAELLWKKP
jgi:tRNA threonylcarbamoyladenosine biosynthesis protein TsaB